MSEEALVNTGVDGWPGEGRAYLTVRRMQTKLHDWAVKDHGRRFRSEEHTSELQSR